MTDFNYNYIKTKGAPIKMWTKGVGVEDTAMQQLQDLARMPFIYNHIAVMPDVHTGKGCTIGTIVATEGAVIPAAVGVDIGCGMYAILTDLTAEDMSSVDLHQLRLKIESKVPHGRSDHGGDNDKGQHQVLTDKNTARWSLLASKYNEICVKHPKLEHKRAAHQLSTLGGGNHFLEMALDELDRVWIIVHSGSRGAGGAIGAYFTDLAQKEMERYFISGLPNKDLAYLVEGTEIFNDYMEAVRWAQDYASMSREGMIEASLEAISDKLNKNVSVLQRINSHHNYVTKENHFGKNVWVTRKGAVCAREGMFGIIPGSMGARTFIVTGKGNKDSFNSCSHGAGRAMSRMAAKAKYSLADHIQSMKGIESRIDESVIDETPAAYKNIDAVMKAQADLVNVEHELHQILNIKG